MQDKYKEWVVKDGNPSKSLIKITKCQLPDEFSALGLLAHLRKSVSRHVPVKFPKYIL